jgi:hypothetical protein
MKNNWKWMVLPMAVLAAQIQLPGQVQRARITGSRGNSGKCTMEVRVDIAAEVDIYGDSGRLRTLAGQPATWTRMECTDPLPYNMSDFRFKGVDGRGDVRLIQDPRNNNGVAVIRIDDPKSGSEGYTFDIEWSGASGGSPTGGGFPGGNNFPGDGRNGGIFPNRGGNRGISAERAIDLCRNEVRAHSDRDYGFRDIDITAAAVDTNPGRREWVVGTFSDRAGNFRRGAGYRFNCAVDFNSGQVRAVEILRADGSPIPPGQYNQGGYDQNQVFRACQDAAVARANRDGYQNIRFESTRIDPRRNDWVEGALTGTRGPVTDTFVFACSMDLRAARVRNLEYNRR